MRRLWYDLRSQSMFEESLREAVLQIDKTLEEMVWRVVSRYAELSCAEPAMTSHAAYGVLDGLFQQALLAHTCGDEAAALDELAGQVRQLMPLMLRQP
jgi:TetR/AcrR family transcriptional repressor of bet genes